MYKEHGTAPVALIEENARSSKDSNISTALNFATKGGELLKRTRKGDHLGGTTFSLRQRYYKTIILTIVVVDAGDLHWKQVSFNINSNCQVKKKIPAARLMDALYLPQRVENLRF